MLPFNPITVTFRDVHYYVPIDVSTPPSLCQAPNEASNHQSIVSGICSSLSAAPAFLPSLKRAQLVVAAPSPLLLLHLLPLPLFGRKSICLEKGLAAVASRWLQLSRLLRMF